MKLKSINPKGGSIEINFDNEVWRLSGCPTCEGKDYIIDILQYRIKLLEVALEGHKQNAELMMQWIKDMK